MEALECILTRRSVRKFVPNKNIDKNILEEILRAAQYAPSAHNKQEWEFIVIEDKKVIDGMSKYQPWLSFAKDASAVIVACSDLEAAFHDFAEGWSFSDIDCALSVQNLMLAAHAKGLGTCFCASAPIPRVMDGLQEDLNLPDRIRPVGIIAIGYPEGEIKQPVKDRYKSEKVHWGEW